MKDICEICKKPVSGKKTAGNAKVYHRKCLHDSLENVRNKLNKGKTMNSLEILKNAKEILSPIPAEEWIVGDFSDGVGKCCAVGHYTRLTSDNPDDYSKKNCDDFHKDDRRFRDASKDGALCIKLHSWEDIAGINNGHESKYQQNNPKDRVITFLDDAINCLESKNRD